MPLQPYVIRQGDHLTALAVRYGFDAAAVWNDPSNKSLRKLRGDPAVLCPGDVIHIPPPKQTWLAVSVGSKNNFSAKVPTVPLRVAFQGRDGKPLAGEPYTIEGLPTVIEGTTDGDGVVSAEVPATAASCLITLKKTNVVYVVLIGHLDPAAEPSGVRQRLGHLGYHYGWLDRFGTNLVDPSLAVRAFQRDQGLAVTGEVDGDTSAALAQEHGT